MSEMRKTNPHYSSGIYVNDKRLSLEWKLRSVTHKSLTRSYFYNLPEDDSKQPLVENYLSVVEGDYAKYSREIIEKNISNENMSFMAYFVTIQFMRVEAFIVSTQGSWDKISEIMDHIDGGNRYAKILKHITKRQLVQVDIGNLLHPNSAVIYNKTNLPFITSDNPVTRRQINIVDALKIVPKRYLLEIENESIEFACFFLPLTPNVAYISCELIRRLESISYSNSDLENIFYLNYFSITNSYEKVYSSVIDPMKDGGSLADHLSPKDATIVKIYTQSKRIFCKGSIEKDTEHFVLLKLYDLGQVSLIKNKEQVKLMEVIKNGVSIRGMRQCKISVIDHVNGLIEIKPSI